MYPLARPFLFALDAERAHGMALRGMDLAHSMGLSRLLTAPSAPFPTKLLGLTFPNPVGLAAGLDKNGDHIEALFALGFGFVEVGTVTPRAQAGNSAPRLFRVPEHRAIINRMGFNNGGVQPLADRLLPGHRVVRPDRPGTGLSGPPGDVLRAATEFLMARWSRVPVEQRARAMGLNSIFVLTTRTMHWFIKRGFEPVDADWLPEARKKKYNWDHKSQVLVKKLG